MILSVCKRAVSGSSSQHYSSRTGQRYLSKSHAASRPGVRVHSRRAQLGALAIAGVLSGTGYIYWRRPEHVVPDVHHASTDAKQQSHKRQTSLVDLLRTYVVYSMCSVPLLVDYSPAILSVLLSVPGVNYVTESFVRATFFSQFVGGDTALGTLPLLEKLRSENKGCLFAYSVEVNEDEAAGRRKSHGASHVQPMHKHIIDEMIHCIDVAADFEDKRRATQNKSTIAIGRRTWVAVKLTALLPDAQALINFSKYLVDTRPPAARPVCFPGTPRSSDFDVFDVDPLNLPETCPLTKEDLGALRELRQDLFKVCQRAKERGVKIIIDAEHSWYQPAIDAYQRDLMAEFNRVPPKSRSSIFSRAIGKESRRSSTQPIQEYPLVQPLVYGTFQCYLRRTPEHLAQSLLDAEANNYALGVKLVRGAYHPLELETHATRRLVNAEGKAAISVGSGLSFSAISPESLPPIWENKEETDVVYNTCARMLIKRVAHELTEASTQRDRNGKSGRRPSIQRLGILFGTHNRESCDLILGALVSEGLATLTREDGSDVVCISDDAAEHVTLGQLYGTRDALTEYLVEKTRSTDPFVIKYVPYGKLSEVMPYLARRAVENKYVLGNGVAQEERQQAGAEIMRRLYGLFTW